MTQLTMTATWPDEEGCLGVWTMVLLQIAVSLWEHAQERLHRDGLWQADLLWQVVP